MSNPFASLSHSLTLPTGLNPPGSRKAQFARVGDFQSSSKIIWLPEKWHLVAYCEKKNSGDIPNSTRCSFQCSYHPAALAEPRGTLMDPGGTLVEPLCNLTSGPPQTTPEPIWAETPKLSAVGEKKRCGFVIGFLIFGFVWVFSFLVFRPGQCKSHAFYTSPSTSAASFSTSPACPAIPSINKSWVTKSKK